MTQKSIHIGNNIQKRDQNKVNGEIVTIRNKEYFKISNYGSMQPFFMSIVSDSDLWMFISSNGALSAGRKNPDNALFPYYTDDKIHDSQEITGNKTIIIANKKDKHYLWEPFSSKYQGVYNIEKNIYKNKIGNSIIFEEINFELGLTFQYEWHNCDQFGFVKKSRVINNDSDSVNINIIDGIQNILPSGIDRKFQLELSTLVDGYKKNELLPESNLGLYMLSSVPTDKAEPSEALIATTVWSAGLEKSRILLSSTQLDAFRNCLPINQEIDIRARRGAYLIQSEFQLEENAKEEWKIIADLNKNQSDVALLTKMIKTSDNLDKEIEKALDESSESLLLKIAKADGCQLTNDTLNIFRHYSNTLFNIMRGGIFDDNYQINRNDFINFIKKANKQTAKKYSPILEKLAKQVSFSKLIDCASEDDPNYTRLCNEYLPLSFSRRHGDPSRPWNIFSIDIKDENGDKILNYQGNWRDIFQNWEALALSFPEYIENMISKFVNASTADGYNPYRLIRDGFDWEIIDPDDPWAYIGYWGDHQIIYLLKLLEVSDNYHPGKLKSLLHKEIFTYANVPYKIKSYDKIIEDPYNTVDYDFDLNNLIEKRVENIGIDGKFILDEDDQVYYVNLMEKLLVPMLVKFSNFVPEAGIWMNTQRPEWNDANNALVGNGTSMVTLYYLRRFVNFFTKFLKDIDVDSFKLSGEVFELFSNINNGFKKYQNLLKDSISDKNRKKITDTLSSAGSEHRNKIYKNGFSDKKQNLSLSELKVFLNLGLKYIDHSIKANKRNDNLFHAYNLIKFKDDKINIRHLYEMLEGQVAVLSSGYPDSHEIKKLLKALRESSLYREDQNSYILYPNRQLARFTDKNIISPELLKKSKTLLKLIKENDKSIVIKDVSENVHFHSDFRNAGILKEKLKEHSSFTNDEIEIVLEIYESVFDHQSFTGRSGTFYKFEGLGSIYWHMVSKLLLAVQENYHHALKTGTDQSLIDTLKSKYYEIRQGIGSHKNPEKYGAFPTDPYSHTPEHCGVLQPGMTGQVKEDYISRYAELGVIVNYGKISFIPNLLHKSEFLSKPGNFQYFDTCGNKKSMEIKQNCLAFTVAQVPVIYHLSKEEKIIIYFNNNDVKTIEGKQLNEEISSMIFNRNCEINKIEVFILNM